MGPLATLVGLEKLSVAGTFIEDLKPLSNCTQLVRLDLSYCKYVESLEPLAGMIALRTLMLRGTSVDDIEPLQNLIQKGELDILQDDAYHEEDYPEYYKEGREFSDDSGNYFYYAQYVEDDDNAFLNLY